jgi:hypothetical protein
MKNKLFLLGTLVVIAGVVFSFSGCSLMQTVSQDMNYRNWGAFGEATAIPVKDFESRGLIFTEVVFKVDSGNGKIDGNVFTYQELLKKAQALGADAVINVTIDKRVENVTIGLKTLKQETWYGSALAIKYTNALTQGDVLQVNTPRIYSLSGSASTTVEAPVK